MAKQQTLTIIVADDAPDPADLIARVLLDHDYGVVMEVADSGALTSWGHVVVVLEED